MSRISFLVCSSHGASISMGLVRHVSCHGLCHIHRFPVASVFVRTLLQLQRLHSRRRSSAVLVLRIRRHRHVVAVALRRILPLILAAAGHSPAAHSRHHNCCCRCCSCSRH